MADWKPIRKPIAVATTILVLLLGALSLVWGVWGEGIVRDASEGASLSWLNRLFDTGGRIPFEVILDQARERLMGQVAILVSLYALVVLLMLVKETGRPGRWVLPALLVWWLGVETCAAPFLLRTFRLQHYGMIRDVDHRPTQVGPGMNSEGIRGAPESDEFREEDINLIFLGDSFTYGFKVQANQAFPAIVERQLRIQLGDDDLRVVNFGWTSSSPLLSYRRLVDIGDKYRPDVVVLNLDMTDFHDDIRWANMLERRGLYELYYRMPITIRMADALAPDVFKRVLFATVGNPPIQRYFITELPLEETRAWFDPLICNVEAIHRWCEERDVSFVLVILPRYYQYDEREAPNSWERDLYTVMGPYALEPFRFFEEYASGVDYPIVPLLEAFAGKEAFPTCFEDDPHWNPQGHQVAAAAIVRALLPVVRRL
jgi:lysophospholipase L1-like esterase